MPNTIDTIHDISSFVNNFFVFISHFLISHFLSICIYFYLPSCINRTVRTVSYKQLHIRTATISESNLYCKQTYMKFFYNHFSKSFISSNVFTCGCPLTCSPISFSIHTISNHLSNLYPHCVNLPTNLYPICS